MSRTLERRTARLEARRSNVNQIAIIIRRIVGRQIFRAVIGDDVVDRRVDEAEGDFVERATVGALARTEHRPCRALLLPEQVLQWGPWNVPWHDWKTYCCRSPGNACAC